MNEKQNWKGRFVVAVVCAIVAMLFPMVYGILGVWGALEGSAPVLLLLILIPAVVIVGLVIALVQRYKELKGGEEDASGNY